MDETERQVGRFSGLLVTIAVMLGVLSWASETGRSGIFISMSMTLMLIGAVYAASHRRSHLFVGLSVAVPAFLTQWAWELFQIPLLRSASLGLTAVFLFLTMWFVVYAIRSRTQVDLDTVLGGVSAYLLLVVAFMFVHGLLEVAIPGSYLFMGSELGDLSTQRGPFVGFFYFSMVTITTLGYGDIVPAKSLARIACGLEAFVGQLFVAIVIARLVSVAAMSAKSEAQS